MTTRIVGTGSYLPKKVVTNDDLSNIMDTSDEWISSRTGIRQRHLATEESNASMCAEAAKRALEDAGMTAGEIDLIIVGTITPDHATPSLACEISALIGAERAVCFDINAACSGFVYSLHTAHAFLTAGIYQNAIVIGAEVLSRIMDWGDRSTCVLFGDGAGAAVVRTEETGIIAFDQGSDGVKGSVLSCINRRNNNPFVSESKELDYVQMDGKEVYSFAVSTVPKSIMSVLEKANIEPEQVDYFLLHQANVRILDSVAKRLKMPKEKFPISLDHCGNISAGSIPILLDEVNKKGLLKRGQKIILSGFGGGLTWGTTLLEW